MTIAPMTKLDAVNICLQSIGETMVADIESGGIDAQTASGIVDEVSRRVQDKGWHWNRERYKLSPDSNGNIILPANVSKVDTVAEDYYTDVVQRGLKLYNRKDNTYVFTAPLTVELFVTLPFEELPTSAKIFIAATAAMTFQQRVVSSETINKDLSGQAKDAWIELIRADIEAADYNMLRDSWSVAGVLNRGQFRRGMYR